MHRGASDFIRECLTCEGSTSESVSTSLPNTPPALELNNSFQALVNLGVPTEDCEVGLGEAQ